MNPSTRRALTKLNLIRILSAHPDGLTLEELTSVLGYKSTSRLKQELGELYMIEMYPYSPTDAIDIEFDGEKVKIHLPISMDSAFALTPKEWILLRDFLWKEKESYTEAKSILAKMQPILPSAEWSPFQESRERINKAIISKTCIEITYWKASASEWSNRKLAPYFLLEENNSYLIAYDLNKEDFRSFRLDRISEVTTADFLFPKLEKKAIEWITEFQKNLSPTEDISQTAIIWSTESALYHLGLQIPITRLPKSQQIFGQEYYQVECPIPEETWWLNTIFQYGDSILIESPLHLKEALLQMLDVSK